jgi:hypothetical protein
MNEDICGMIDFGIKLKEMIFYGIAKDRQGLVVTTV